MKIKNLRLYVITDKKLLKGLSLAEAVEQAILGGADMIQLREKAMSCEELLGAALEVKVVTDRYNVPLIINDSLEVCLESGAAGVHIGQNDADIREARAFLGENKIIGVSARTVEQAKYAEENGADYIGVGAAFATGSKNDARCIPHGIYREIRNAVSLPIVAIGGINKTNIADIKGLGIDGAAVISAVFGSGDIRAAASEMKKLCVECFGKNIR